MPITHQQLLGCMEQLGYEIYEMGMCFGFACMAMQAVLSEDLATYNARLSMIEQLLKEGKNLAQEIENARNKIIKKGELSGEEKMILSIPAFFEGVELYFDPVKYSHLFEEKERPKDQNAELTFPRILPHELTTREEKVNVEKVSTFSGIYNLEELKNYFQILRETLKEQKYTQPISFMLLSSNHVVTVGYDPQNQCWQWIDAGQAERIEIDDTIAEKIMNAFSRNGITTFSTHVYCRKPEVDQVKSYLAACQKSEAWEEIFSVTAEKSQMKDSYDVAWLYIAAESGNLDVVKSLLDFGANPDLARADDRTTALFIAAQNGYQDIVQLLLAVPADPNLARIDNVTALYMAVRDGYYEIVRLLLIAHANPDQAREDGRTALYIAAENGDPEIVRLLLDAHANPNLVCADGTTALYIAAYQGHLEIVKLLLDAHADPNQLCINGATALYVAAENGHVEVVKLLLGVHANPDLAGTDNGATALYIAAQQGHLDVVRALLESHANPNIPIIGSTPFLLAYAKAHNRENEIKDLLRKNSQIILDKWPGFRPLHAAIFFGHTQVVKLFLEDKRIEIPENPNLIDLALAMNRVEIVDILEKLKKKQGEEKDKSAESELNNGMRRYRQ